MLLNVSQPSISAAIRDLELAFRQPLFLRRQAKGLELTVFGAVKLKDVETILQSIDQLTENDGNSRNARLEFG